MNVFFFINALLNELLDTNTFKMLLAKNFFKPNFQRLIIFKFLQIDY